MMFVMAPVWRWVFTCDALHTLRVAGSARHLRIKHLVTIDLELSP